jgi:hypothetical protein
MNPATVALIIDGVTRLAPYVAELGNLARKVQANEPVNEADLARAEAARRTAFAALREQLTPDGAGS